MITVYLLNNTEQKYKYNKLEYKDYGEFVQNVVKQIKWYIFSIGNIIITINDEELKLDEVDLNDNINSNEISKIDIYERKRDTNGNVCKSELVENFLKWNQYREDCQFAKELEDSYNNGSNLNYLDTIINRIPSSFLSQSLPHPANSTNSIPATETYTEPPTDSNIDLDSTSQFHTINYNLSDDVFPLPPNTTIPPINSTYTINTTFPQNTTLPPLSTNFLEFIRRVPPPPPPTTIPLPIQPSRPIQLSQQILSTFIENIGGLGTEYSLTTNEVDEMTDVKVVLNDDEIVKCRKCTFKDIKDDDTITIVDKCNFTLEEFQDDSEIVCLPCGHYFMSNEITEWLTNHSHKCPVCRKEAGKGTVL